MVTSAIFAPNPVEIMTGLHSSHDYSPSLPRSPIPTTTISNVNPNRVRSTFVYASSNSNDGSMNNNSSIYVMVTADSKGQLKLLVNRYHR